MASEHVLLHSSYHHPVLRQWNSTDTVITPSNLMYPLFIGEEADSIEPIPSLPDQNKYGVNRLPEVISPLVEKGLKSVLLFSVVEKTERDDRASAASVSDNPVILAVKALKKSFPGLLVVCDVCLCPFTSHGHCGILREDGTVDNELTIERVGDISVSYAKAGCDVIAPSGIMDGRILRIKKKLFENGFGRKVSVMSYSAKFVSAFYGPFRDANKSETTFGDRQCYQLPPGSSGLAMRAVDRDVKEGADFLMVKPGTAYLDLVHRIKQKYPDHPMAVYHVSGEYAQLWYASQAGAMDLREGVMETLHSMRRAGADILITYYTPKVLEWLRE